MEQQQQQQTNDEDTIRVPFHKTTPEKSIQPQEQTAYKALLISNTKFGLHDTPTRKTHCSGQELARALSDPRTGLFDTRHIQTLLDRPSYEIRRKLDQFFTKAKPHEVLFLYYQSHMTDDARARFFFCAPDTETDLLSSTAVEIKTIDLMAKTCAARGILIILDYCHKTDLTQHAFTHSLLAGPNRYIIAGNFQCDSEENSHNTAQSSILTRSLVKILEGNHTNKEKLIDFDALADYMIRACQRENKPIPRHMFDGAGDIPIAGHSENDLPLTDITRDISPVKTRESPKAKRQSADIPLIQDPAGSTPSDSTTSASALTKRIQTTDSLQIPPPTHGPAAGPSAKFERTLPLPDPPRFFLFRHKLLLVTALLLIITGMTISFLLNQ